jgi:hypothetical protein
MRAPLGGGVRRGHDCSHSCSRGSTWNTSPQTRAGTHRSRAARGPGYTLWLVEKDTPYGPAVPRPREPASPRHLQAPVISKRAEARLGDVVGAARGGPPCRCLAAALRASIHPQLCAPIGRNRYEVIDCVCSTWNLPGTEGRMHAGYQGMPSDPEGTYGQRSGNARPAVRPSLTNRDGDGYRFWPRQGNQAPRARPTYMRELPGRATARGVDAGRGRRLSGRAARVVELRHLIERRPS